MPQGILDKSSNTLLIIHTCLRVKKKINFKSEILIKPKVKKICVYVCVIKSMLM